MNSPDQLIRCLWCGEPPVNVFNNMDCLNGYPCAKCIGEQFKEAIDESAYMKWLRSNDARADGP